MDTAVGKHVGLPGLQFEAPTPTKSISTVHQALEGLSRCPYNVQPIKHSDRVPGVMKILIGSQTPAARSSDTVCTRTLEVSGRFAALWPSDPEYFERYSTG